MAYLYIIIQLKYFKIKTYTLPYPNKCLQRIISKIFKILNDASIFTAECLSEWESIKFFKQNISENKCLSIVTFKKKAFLSYTNGILECHYLNKEVVMGLDLDPKSLWNQK